MTGRILFTLPALLALMVAVGFGIQPGPVEATEYNTKSPIDAAQAESANAGATGSGTAFITYDTATNLLSWNMTWSGTQGSVIDAHFHGPAEPGVGAGIQVQITDQTSPSIESATITEAQEAQLLDGLWYVNIHTTHSPSGEIRGQITNVAGDTIGGIAELPGDDAAPLAEAGSSGGSGGLAIAIAALAAGAMVVVGGGGWLAWRRVQR